MSKKRAVSITFSEDQYQLIRRRLFIEEHTWNRVARALFNAYITGDISVTAKGRYHLAPPSHHIPVVEIEGSNVEIEPDWTVGPRPQVGHNHGQQKPRERKVWGTRELALHLREVTGRKLSLQIVRKLLIALDVPKTSEKGVWKFPKGPDDENIPRIIEAISEGVYDALVTHGTTEARAIMEARVDKTANKTEAQKIRAEQKRLAHLKRLRKASED